MIPAMNRLVYSMIIRNFAAREPAKPLNDAQMCGSFLFFRYKATRVPFIKNISMAVGRRDDARKAKGWTLVFRASLYLLRGRFARRRKSLAYSAGKACSERFHCSMNLSIISVPFSVQHPRSITMMVLTKISLMV